MLMLMRKRQCLLALLLAHQADAFAGHIHIQIHRPDAGAVRLVRSGPHTGFLLRMSATANPPTSSSSSSSSSTNDTASTSTSSTTSTSGTTTSTEIKSLNGKNNENNDINNNNIHHSRKAAHSSSSSRSKQTKLENRQGKRRNNNPAMGDTAFLRKRTSELLRVTSKDHLANPNTALSLSSATTTNTNSNNTDGVVVATNSDVNDGKVNDGKVNTNAAAMDVPLSGGMKIGRKTFNFLIDAWAFSGEMDAADQALDLLARMEELSDYAIISPDVRSYTKVINAVSRSMRADAGEIAENLLDKMEHLVSTGANPSAKPNTFTYTAVIEAYANSGAQGSAIKAEEMCEAMIEKYESGDPHVRPTARCFNAVINACAKSGNPNAAQQAEYIFDRMEGLYMSGVDEARPNTFNYNTLISAWANCAEEGSAERAEDVLARLEKCYKKGDASCKPTAATFNAVIDAYAKSGEEGSAQHAEQVLRRMEDLAKSGEDVKPNTRSFNSVMNAWAKSREEGAEAKAQDLLDLMSKLYEEGNKTVRPDVHSFVTVINAWARSSQDCKAERAKNLFRQMKSLYQAGNKNLRPNVIAVNAVMNACAFTKPGHVKEQNRAMEIAHHIWKDLEKSDYGKPDQVTYGTFLKVCANQMSDCSTRHQVIEVIFKKCCRDGQVGKMVLQQMRAMGPKDVYLRLVGKDIDDEEVKIEDLPHEWWVNVVEGKWRRRRNLN